MFSSKLIASVRKEKTAETKPSKKKRTTPAGARANKQDLFIGLKFHPVNDTVNLLDDPIDSIDLTIYDISDCDTRGWMGNLTRGFLRTIISENRCDPFRQDGLDILKSTNRFIETSHLVSDHTLFDHLGRITHSKRDFPRRSCIRLTDHNILPRRAIKK